MLVRGSACGRSYFLLTLSHQMALDTHPVIVADAVRVLGSAAFRRHLCQWPAQQQQQQQHGHSAADNRDAAAAELLPLLIPMLQVCVMVSSGNGKRGGQAVHAFFC